MTAEATPTTATQLLRSVSDGVLTLTLNRPEVLNAITPGLLDEVTGALVEAASGRTVRAVIITGASVFGRSRSSVSMSGMSVPMAHPAISIAV